MPQPNNPKPDAPTDDQQLLIHLFTLLHLSRLVVPKLEEIRASGLLPVGILPACLDADIGMQKLELTILGQYPNLLRMAEKMGIEL